MRNYFDLREIAGSCQTQILCIQLNIDNFLRLNSTQQVFGTIYKKNRWPFRSMDGEKGRRATDSWTMDGDFSLFLGAGGWKRDRESRRKGLFLRANKGEVVQLFPPARKRMSNKGDFLGPN